MFIIWGTRDWEKKRGVVADKCACCGKVGLHRVVQHYDVPHLYFIPVWAGTLKGTVLHCVECRGKTLVDAAAFSQFVPEKQAKGLTVAELLQQSNPRLAEWVAERAKLEQEAREVREVAPGQPDPRAKLALAKLSDLNEFDPQVTALLARLTQWAALDARGQAQFLGEVDDIVARAEQKDATVQFLRSMTQRFKPEADALAWFLTTIIVAGPGIAASVFWLPTEEAKWIGAIVSVVAAFVLGVLVHSRVTRRAHKRFYQKTFIPEAKNRGVVIEDAMAMLNRINPRDEGIDANIRGMAKTLPLLKEVLEEQARAAPLSAQEQ